MVNTNPTMFWVIFHVFSRPDYLRQCRDEACEIMTTKEEDGKFVRSLDISQLKQCPTLVMIFQEALRVHTISPSVRRVVRETSVGEYVLKEGITLYIPSVVFHTDREVWGSDVGAFNPERWQENSASKLRGTNAVAMRPFGGGQTLCPGRHFAMTEVLAMVVMLIMRFDLEPVGGSGWKEPSTNNTSPITSVLQPDSDIEVRVQERAEYRNDEWAFELHESDHVFAIAAEDKQ